MSKMNFFINLLKRKKVSLALLKNRCSVLLGNSSFANCNQLLEKISHSNRVEEAKFTSKKRLSNVIKEKCKDNR